MNDLVVLQQALAHTINADPVLCLILPRDRVFKRGNSPLFRVTNYD